MPVEVIKYTCEFKCGTPSKSLNRIKTHEATCFKNPARRACSTCKNEEYYLEVIDHPELEGCPSQKEMVRGCKKIRDEEFEELLAKSNWHNSPVMHKLPVINCPHWESKHQ